MAIEKDYRKIIEMAAQELEYACYEIGNCINCPFYIKNNNSCYFYNNFDNPAQWESKEYLEKKQKEQEKQRLLNLIDKAIPNKNNYITEGFIKSVVKLSDEDFDQLIDYLEDHAYLEKVSYYDDEGEEQFLYEFYIS